MSAESDFEDTVKICEFYADQCGAFEVDLENHIVFIGDREVSPVRVGGRLDCYLVVEPDGVTHWVDDLDSYFQAALGWEDR